MMSTIRTSRCRRARLGAAFSLIEVLIAILILALGLLGLGAVIPVVVREQRVAAEATRAVIAANNAKAYLEARPDLNRLVGVPRASRGSGGGLGGSSTPSPMGFGVWLEDPGWSVGAEPGWDSAESQYTGYDFNSGEWRLPRSGSQGIVIPLRDRLWPDPSSEAEPQLVWDFAARRVWTGDPSEPEIERTVEIALFVRRVDPAIRVAPGRRLSEVLLLPPGDRDFRLAVAVSDRDTGRPSGDGTGFYAEPRLLLASFWTAGRQDVLELNTESGAGGVERATVPGQALVDRHGNIYRVLRRLGERDGVTGGNLVIQVDPPVPSAVAARMGDLQMVYTPQIPAAVEVFRITIPASPAESPNGSGAGMMPWYGHVGQTQ